jgi:hypothetical protein
VNTDLIKYSLLNFLCSLLLTVAQELLYYLELNIDHSLTKSLFNDQLHLILKQPLGRIANIGSYDENLL